MRSTSMSLLTVVLLLLTAPTGRAADYWPTDATRTYVFGEPPEAARLVIDPGAGTAVSFRVVNGNCDVRWDASVVADGTMTATTATVDCPSSFPEVTTIEFENGQEVVFDPAWIGGNTVQVQGTVGVELVNLYVRISQARPVTIPEGTFDAIQYRVAVDPFFLLPILDIDLAIDAGPIRVLGHDRTAVLEGVVDSAERTFGAIKARFGED